ncbi:tetratricopeptide repeat protein [Calditrichota bacterium GD2]
MKYLFFFFCLFTALLAAQTPYLKQAERLIHQHQFDQALELLKAHQTDPEALYYQSVIHLVRGNINRAIELAEKGLAKAQDKDRFYEWLGDIYSVKAQTANIFSAMLTAANIKNNWQKAIEFNPDNLKAKEKLFMFYLMAPQMAGGDQEQALKLAKEIAQKDTLRGRLLMARYYQKQKDVKRAEETYLSAFNQAPDSIHILHELASFYMNQKQFEKARKYVRKILELKPQQAESYDFFGDFYLQQDKPDSALTQYEKAIEIDPFLYRIQFKKAKVLARLGRKNEARAIAQKLLNEEVFFTMKRQLKKFIDQL